MHGYEPYDARLPVSPGLRWPSRSRRIDDRPSGFTRSLDVCCVSTCPAPCHARIWLGCGSRPGGSGRVVLVDLRRPSCRVFEHAARPRHHPDLGCMACGSGVRVPSLKTSRERRRLATLLMLGLAARPAVVLTLGSCQESGTCSRSGCGSGSQWRSRPGWRLILMSTLSRTHDRSSAETSRSGPQSGSRPRPRSCSCPDPCLGPRSDSRSSSFSPSRAAPWICPLQGSRSWVTLRSSSTHDAEAIIGCPGGWGSFLHWCYQAGLVRVAGIGYQFRHRELQDYFVRNPGAPLKKLAAESVADLPQQYHDLGKRRNGSKHTRVFGMIMHLEAIWRPHHAPVILPSADVRTCRYDRLCRPGARHWWGVTGSGYRWRPFRREHSRLSPYVFV